MLLYILLVFEIILRLFLEIRERRITQYAHGVFSIFRILPLVNDIVPLPENRREVPENPYIQLHEEGHKNLHHSILRNLVKIAFFICAIWFLSGTLFRFQLPIWEGILWLHLAAIPCRLLFHWYCFIQEFEADNYAAKQIGKKKAKQALAQLATYEIPYTKFFALCYREHPTAIWRKNHLLKSNEK